MDAFWYVVSIHPFSIHLMLMSRVLRGRLETYRIDNAHHTILYTTIRRAAVKEDRIRIVDPDTPFRHLCDIHDYIYRLVARVEADFIGRGVFVGDARVLIFCAHDGVVCWVESELDDLLCVRIRCSGKDWGMLWVVTYISFIGSDGVGFENVAAIADGNCMC